MLQFLSTYFDGRVKFFKGHSSCRDKVFTNNIARLIFNCISIKKVNRLIDQNKRTKKILKKMLKDSGV